ncbi:hypothetical protein N7495_008939 [Penicillium taxi]|uniref:uncharacterized protein n=1 Tax=Penicillium taxi TaxID=168475 RepID=UPI0025456396|nr:uncharacterized protein N7495_008939 [Penicillium taxi]KAJ5888898.1 hypothetical protein N7495_008939 [Penicillium taxi]
MTHGGHVGDKKEPDFTMRPRSQLPSIIPVMALEVGWSQTYSSLHANAVFLLKGGSLTANRYILVKYTIRRQGVQAVL